MMAEPENPLRPGAFSGKVTGMNTLFGAALLANSDSSGAWPLLIFFVTVSLGFSFLCSVAEAVLLSVSRPYILQLKKTQPKAAERLESLKSNVDEPLAAILTLNTVAHTVGATLAGTQAAVLFKSFGMGVFSAVFTLIILVGSEIIPKTLGALYWRRLAPSSAIVIQLLIKLLYPFVWLSKAITSRLGPAGHPGTHGLDELRAMAELVSAQGQMDAHESLMLKNLLLFRETKTEDIMTPRTVVFTLPLDLTVGDYVEKYADSPFSRIPVYGANRDEVKGFVLRIHLLKAHSRGESAKTLEEFLQPIQAVSAKASLAQVFARMSKNREHIALVVDEFGSARGIITLEDIVETLVGFEIVDELDEDVDMQNLARTLWRRRAERMGIEIPDDHVLDLTAPFPAEVDEPSRSGTQRS